MLLFIIKPEGKMPKCPYCPSRKFNMGKIAIGKDGSIEVIYCSICKSVIFCKDSTLKKPSLPYTERKLGVPRKVEMLGL